MISRGLSGPEVWGRRGDGALAPPGWGCWCLSMPRAGLTSHTSLRPPVEAPGGPGKGDVEAEGKVGLEAWF